MSLLVPCSSCAQRKPGKLANLTWAWWTAANDRVAYRQKLCTDCFVVQVVPIQIALESGGLVCPGCHTDSSKDLDPIYCTMYVPGQGKEQLEMPCCPACAVAFRSRAQEGAERLDDRPDQFGGQGATPGPQTPPPSDPWARILASRQS